jgi:hypothetical protein
MKVSLRERDFDTSFAQRTVHYNCHSTTDSEPFVESAGPEAEHEIEGVLSEATELYERFGIVQHVLMPFGGFNQDLDDLLGIRPICHTYR